MTILAGSEPETCPVPGFWIEADCGLPAIQPELVTEGGMKAAAGKTCARAPRACSLDGASRDKKEGVDIVHTLGFGFGCTGVGPGRSGDVFGGVADYQGERLVRVPSWARVFPVQGLLSL
jgi:hypothetical protein